MHSNKVIKGFILKKWKYNNGYEIYDVYETQHFELKPGEQGRSFGCNHVTQNQPAEFTPYGKFYKIYSVILLLQAIKKF
ncbi:hypothetical protein A1704_23455 [Chryseobacterium cucumeris]|nr:hypothetical protein A1704_23455 [Chryseobacterium cucumeris]